MSELSPHAQYVQDLMYLGLTWFDGGPDTELLVRALKHMRPRTCDVCAAEARERFQNPGEECVLRACGDPKGYTGTTRELIDAINAKLNSRKSGRADGVR